MILLLSYYTNILKIVYSVLILLNHSDELLGTPLKLAFRAHALLPRHGSNYNTGEKKSQTF